MVSELGLGCARIGGIFQHNSNGFLNLLSAARDSGINFFDTADIYSQGESETLIGRAFRRTRSRVVIATKAGYCLPARRRFAARLKPLLRPVIRSLGIRRDRLSAAARGVLTQNFSPDYLHKAVEASLRRLQTDYLDLLQLHSPPAEVVERGEWEPALEALKRAGKIRYYGISCDTIEVGRLALNYPGMSSLQFLLNLLERRNIDALLPELRAKEVAGIARECLANGVLAKPVEEIDLARYYPTSEEQRHRAEQLADCRRQAAERGTSLTRLALEFASRAEGVSVALIGARTVEQLQSLLDAYLRAPR